MEELIPILLAAIIGIPLMIIIFFAIAIPMFALNGYVITKLWTWFIVPIFALPSLTIPQAIGLDLVVTFLTYHSTVYVPKDLSKEEKIHRTVEGFARPFMMLLAGYVVKHYFL